MSINKKVAIITGVTSFLGRSTAKYLLEKGFIVFGIVRYESDISKISNLVFNSDKSLSTSNFHIIRLDFNKLLTNDFINLLKNDNFGTLETINKIKEINSNITFIHFAWGATLDRNNFAEQMINIDMSLKFLENHLKLYMMKWGHY